MHAHAHICTRKDALIHTQHTHSTHTHTHTHIHTYIHAYIHTCIHTHLHTYIHTYIHTYLHTDIPTDIPTYTHISTCICMHPVGASCLPGIVRCVYLDNTVEPEVMGVQVCLRMHGVTASHLSLPPNFGYLTRRCVNLYLNAVSSIQTYIHTYLHTYIHRCTYHPSIPHSVRSYTSTPLSMHPYTHIHTYTHTHNISSIQTTHVLSIIHPIHLWLSVMHIQTHVPIHTYTYIFPLDHSSMHTHV